MIINKSISINASIINAISDKKLCFIENSIDLDIDLGLDYSNIKVINQNYINDEGFPTYKTIQQ